MFTNVVVVATSRLSTKKKKNKAIYLVCGAGGFVPPFFKYHMAIEHFDFMEYNPLFTIHFWCLFRTLGWQTVESLKAF